MNKSVFHILAFALLIAGCMPSNRQRQPHNARQVSQTNAETSEANNVRPISSEEFKHKVMDYERHPDKWVYEGTRPAVVDFYATWCRPCKMMAPVVEQMAGKYKGKVDFYKVDIDQEEELAAAFGIQSIPTLLFIPAKGMPAMQTGAMPQAELEKAIQTILKR